jgi:hypothetical protein
MGGAISVSLRPNGVSGMTVSGHPLVILVRPGMKVRPFHFQMVVARPVGQQVALADLRAFSGPLQ